MNEQLYLLGMGLTLEEKIEKAIANIRHYESEAFKKDSDNGYYVCNSFGKDSSVLRHLVIQSGVKHTLNYNLTTLDPPELIRFGRQHHAETVWHKKTISLLARAAQSANRGLPTRLKRWCCTEYKEQAGLDKLRVLGVRAAESPRRKNSWKMWTIIGKQQILNPILYWSDDDVWQYIRQNNIPYCDLYDEGFTRLGCVGCPLAGVHQQRIEFDRWPTYERAWKRACQKFWDTHHGSLRKDGEPRWFDRKGWTKWEDYWSWWMREDEHIGQEEGGCHLWMTV